MPAKKSPPDPGKPKKAPAAKKPAAKAKKPPASDGPPKRSAPARKPQGKPVMSKARPPARSWRWVLAREATPIVLGVVAGVLLAGLILWTRANRDVHAFLASPPRAEPTVVWSAPVEVRVGQHATLADLAGDLLAAGYERVEAVDGADQFAVGDGRIDVWTAPSTHDGVSLPGGRATVKFTEGVVTDVGRERMLRLRPTALATLGDLEAQRTEVTLAALSPYVEPAVLAMEDRRFREHGGVDPLGILRALVHNVLRGGPRHGGSTITQQLAKNLFLTQDRHLQRKIREAFFAAALEAQLDKDEILETYLGEVYLGQVGGVPVYGVEQAARGWFGVSAARLSLPEAATIAGVIASPNTWSPVRHPDRAVERRDVVLAAMRDVGAITPAEAEAAMAAPLVVKGGLTGPHRRAPWAVDAAIDALESARSDDGPLDGWAIHTHIQPVWQRAAERAVATGMSELDAEYPKASGAQVALVAVRVSDGAIVAMVGGRDYAESPFNRATRAWRQAGSTVKPLTLLAAFDANPSLTPISRVRDEPITRTQEGGRPWTPRNYDGRFVGEITLREAIEQSRNVPAVKLAEDVGLTKMQGFFTRAGLSRATAWHSAALGAFEATPVEVASAYTVFPGGGSLARPAVLAWAAREGHGEIVRVAPRTETLSSARAAALATAVLQGVVTDGTGARASRYGVRGAAGGKTGTTDDYRDAWFVGFTPELAVAVWVGNDRGEPLGLSGSRAALPTWSRFIAASGTQGGAFPLPDGMTTEDVCAESYQLARPACPRIYSERFATAHVPKERCDEHGSPFVQVGGFFQRLFGRPSRPEVQGEGQGPAE